MKTVEKVWGCEDWIVNNELYCFKNLYLNKGFMCSMHHHLVKDETFVIAEGIVLMEHNGKRRYMWPGDKIRIRPRELHRFSGIEDSIIHEISTTHNDDDSFRTINSGPFGNKHLGDKDV